MKQLDPKAVWLFFINFLLRTIPFTLPVIVMFSSMVLSERQAVVTWVYGFFAWLPVVLAVIILIGWLWARLTYKFYRYELREDGFRKEYGIIWKKYSTIPYDRVQNVDIYRGLIARILGLSDLQIQTAGGITRGSYGAYSEGRLPGLSRETAEQLRDELVNRVRGVKGQGL